MAPQSSQPEFSAVAALDDGQMVVVVRGEVDWATREELNAAIDAGLRVHPGTLIIDLSAVTLMDSTGSQSLVRARNLARKSGADFRLRGITPAVLRTLERLKLVEIFTTIPDAPRPDDG